MDFYEKNLHHLKALDIPDRKHLLSALASTGSLPAVETAVPGCPSFMASDGITAFAIHSLRDPVKEAAKWVASHSLENAAAAVLAGPGLWYAVDNIILNYPNIRKLAVIENNLSHLATALRLRDLSGVLNSPIVKFIPGQYSRVSKHIAAAFDELEREYETSVAVLIHPASLKAMPDSEKGLKDVLSYISDRRRAAKGVMASLGESNAAENAKALAQARGVSGLFDAFKGKPAFIAAPGPSLQKNMSILKLTDGNCVIVTLDAAMRSLFAAGIQPDVIVSLDPQNATSCYVPESIPVNCSLVFFPQTNPVLVKMFPADRRYRAVAETPSSDEHGQGTDDRDTLLVSGSVFLSALDFCRRAGCNPIILTGADHSVKPGASHIISSPASMTVTSPAKIVHCEGYFGLPSASTKSYYIYLRETESYIRKYSNETGFINCTEGGAGIQGAGKMSLAEAFLRFC